MRQLAICLQRIGDTLMVAKTLKAIKDRNPQDELHVLIHRETAAVIPVLPFVDQFHFFEREKWQKSLGEIELSGWEAFSALKGLINNLRDLDFYHVYNLSHTRLASHLTGVIANHSYSGGRIDAWGQGHVSSPWFKELDGHTDLPRTQVFHFSDHMHFGSGFDAVPSEPRTQGTRRGVALQVLTSDEKKNYPLNQWADLIQWVFKTQGNIPITVLCAPFEKERVQNWLQESSIAAGNVSVLCADLKSTAEFLATQNLLISGDTAIKHLAVLSGTPVLELCLGSSEPFLTGTWAENTLIVRSREHCVPCAARGRCHRSEHACAQSFEPAALAMLASQAMDGLSLQLKPIADEYRGQIEILNPIRTADGVWHPIPVAERFSVTNVQVWVSRAFRVMQLNGVTRQSLESYAQLLRRVFPFASQRDWQQVFGDLVFPKDKDSIKQELIQCLKQSN
jgi:ADP-heptose:LPS heptosyltransferase